MTWQDELHAAVRQSVENPTVHASWYGGTVISGIATYVSDASNIIGLIASLVGLIGSVILIRIQWTKYENELIRGRMLRRQAASMGIDILSPEENE